MKKNKYAITKINEIKMIDKTTGKTVLTIGGGDDRKNE